MEEPDFIKYVRGDTSIDRGDDLLPPARRFNPSPRSIGRQLEMISHPISTNVRKKEGIRVSMYAKNPAKDLIEYDEIMNTNHRERRLVVFPDPKQTIEDIRDKGPMQHEYDQRFRPHKTTLTRPKKPVKMEWFEEDELARALYEIMQAE